MTRTLFRLAAAALLAASAVRPAPAAEDPPKPATAAEELGRREALRVIESIDLEALRDGEWVKVQRIEKPLLLFGDPTREDDRGTVWGWGETGRPLALFELFQNADDRRRWAVAMCNTSGGKLRATRGGVPWWRENDSACELKAIPGAPTPAADAPQRQRQLKSLAQKFAGHEFWDPDNTRYELRRLVRPLHTYRDEAGGVLDGGLYTLANGTNPEIMVFVEARVSPSDKTKTSWQFAVGRLAYAELHLDFDGKEVFNAARGERLCGPAKPYWITHVDAPPLDGPKE